MADTVDLGSSVILASDEVRDIYCDPCSKGGNVVSAEGFCVDCSEYLCGQCYTSHRRFKAMENHVLQDKHSMPDPADSTWGVSDVCVEKCSNHPSKVVEFFCETCNILGCYACITVNHRQCEKVQHIPDIINNLETTDKFITFDDQLECIDETLSEYKQKIASNTEINNQMKKMATEELKKQRDRINEFFDELEKKMKSELYHIETLNKECLKKGSNELKAMEIEFDNVKKSMELKKNGQNCELFIAMVKNKQRIETLNDQLNKLPEDMRIQRYTLLPSEQIEAMMRTTTEICRMTTAQFQAKIDISTSKDKNNPNIWGMTTVHGHYCVVTDNGNKSVKVIDTKRECVTSEIGTDASYLWGITSVNDDQVAVAVNLPEGKRQIQFFSVTSSGIIKSTTRQFDVGQACYGLKYYNNNLFACQSDQIQIITMQGQVIQTIRKNSDHVNMFGNLNGISLSQDGKTINVTDGKKQSVISMSLDGNVKAIYHDNDLKNPWGITVDNDGYVYVRGDTRSIHQLTADLSKRKIIIEDVKGTAITFSSTENKLYLGCWKFVSVYDLKNH